MSTSAVSEFSDVACPVCGYVCDDLSVSMEDGRLHLTGGGCELSRKWLEGINGATPPVCRIGGTEVPLEAGYDRAAELLQASRAPLIYGLTRSSTPGQRAAVNLADQCRGTIDTTASLRHGASILAMQQTGISTCTLGEVWQRSDLVIFWGADPASTHPRFLEKLQSTEGTEFLPQGRADRTLVVIGNAASATAKLADLVIPVSDEFDFEAISTLRLLLRKGDVALSERDGFPVEALRALAERMKDCRYGSLFFGLGSMQESAGHLVADGVLRLVAELNSHTRFVARRLGQPSDTPGAENVLCWQTGFPFAVNFGQGSPRYNPGEFSASDMLARGEADCCVLIGSETVQDFSPAARFALSSIPTIVLDHQHQAAGFTPTVQFTTAVYGIHAEGTAYRIDDVPIPQRKLMESSSPTDEDVLDALSSRLPAVR